MRLGLSLNICFVMFLLGCKSSNPHISQLADAADDKQGDKIGIVYAVHGGFERVSDQALWDSTVQMFSYDQNHPIYKFMIWNPKTWSTLLSAPVADKNYKKYLFEYDKIGGIDPFPAVVKRQVQALSGALTSIEAEYHAKFEVETSQWIGVGNEIANLPYPRAIYHSPTNPAIVCNYCGVNGSFSDCNPERYNVDGPFERLANKGVSRIYMIDMTVGGVRFSKTFDVYTMGKKALSDWSKAHDNKEIPLVWANDPKDLMVKSYPTSPAGWTRSSGTPTQDASVDLKDYPNPIAEDPTLAVINADAIAAAFAANVPHQKTAVILLNHPISPNDEYYDPKINDTVVLNKGIKRALLQKYPDLDASLIVGAFMGVKETNPANGQVEFTRNMRSEDLGHAYLYESKRELPTEEWGYRYWDALQYLMSRGVGHIVIGFPQIITDSVLNLVEVPNQIAKEIGTKNWRATVQQPDYWQNGKTPFADYWGVWANTQCGGQKCCFKMGGCGDGGSYPPMRQTPMNKPIEENDPALVFDVSDYGLLGYDSNQGSPAADHPVQNQYIGTWSMYRVPNDDARIIEVLVQHIKDMATQYL